MAFATINFFSQSLRKASSFNIVFPEDPGVPRPWATFYLLHGLSDDHTIWMRRTSIERYVAGLPLVVVMPDGGRGWYTNAASPGGLPYEDDLMKDVVGLVERTFPVKAARAGRAIGGLSVGGFGAVKLGLKYPEMFASMTSHSGALQYLHRTAEEVSGLSPEFPAIFGDHPKGGDNDPFALAERVDPGRIPALSFDCGAEDFLLEDNRAFHRHLVSLKIEHEYREFPGGHDWAYWDTHVQDAVAFHTRHLGLRPSG